MLPAVQAAPRPCWYRDSSCHYVIPLSRRFLHSEWCLPVSRDSEILQWKTESRRHGSRRTRFSRLCSSTKSLL